MSLPWHKASTAAILGLRTTWTTDAPIPEALALVELGALAVSGQLAAKSLTRLSTEWGWSRRTLTRRIRAWYRAGWLGWVDAPKAPISLPEWCPALLETFQKDTADAAPKVPRMCPESAPRARSTLKEVDSEGDIPAPAPWPTTGLERLKRPLTEADIVAWSAYRRHLSPMKRLTSSRLGKMRARVKAIGLDRWVAYCDWLATSRHERAVYLRDRNDPDTALGKEKSEKYLEYLDDGEGAPAVDPATAAVALLDAEVARYGRGDPPVRGGRVVRPMTDPPGLPGLGACLLAALPSVGGWSRWCAADSYERPRLARRLGDEVATLYRGAA
jgi:hypothetical protein